MDLAIRGACRPGGRRPFGTLVWEYLAGDVAKRKQQCRTCQVDEEVVNPEAACAACDVRKLQARFPREFVQWLDALVDLYNRNQAGWRIGNDDLSLEEWRALAKVREWYELRREEIRLRLSRW